MRTLPCWQVAARSALLSACGASTMSPGRAPACRLAKLTWPAGCQSLGGGGGLAGGSQAGGGASGAGPRRARPAAAAAASRPRARATAARCRGARGARLGALGIADLGREHRHPLVGAGEAVDGVYDGGASRDGQRSRGRDKVALQGAAAGRRASGQGESGTHRCGRAPCRVPSSACTMPLQSARNYAATSGSPPACRPPAGPCGQRPCRAAWEPPWTYCSFHPVLGIGI
jgi:hypothetical protein